MGLQKNLALVLGVVLTLVGIAGFAVAIPVFAVNSAHNLVHLVSGLLGIAAALAAGGSYAKWYNVVFGFVYLLVAVLGLFSVGAIVDLLMLNSADNWLHLVIAVVCLGVGFGANE